MILSSYDHLQALFIIFINLEAIILSSYGHLQALFIIFINLDFHKPRFSSVYNFHKPKLYCYTLLVKRAFISRLEKYYI